MITTLFPRAKQVEGANLTTLARVESASPVIFNAAERLSGLEPDRTPGFQRDYTDNARPNWHCLRLFTFNPGLAPGMMGRMQRLHTTVRHMGIDLRGGQIAVPEQQLDHTQVCTVI